MNRSPLIDEGTEAALVDLRFDFKEAFSLEHHGENEKRPSVLGIVEFDQFAQEGFRGLFLDGLRRCRGRHVIDTLPVGNESLPIGRALAELSRPASSADIQAFVAVLLIEEQGVEQFLIHKMPMAGLTRVAAALDIPLDHFVSFLWRP